MRKLVLFFIFISFISCKKEVVKSETETPKVASLENGEALFQENNCASCHQPDQKVVGPSLKEIANIYKEKKGSIVSFLKEEANPIVDESMFETMKINLQVTKKMSDEELKSLEIYISNQAK